MTKNIELNDMHATVHSVALMDQECEVSFDPRGDATGHISPTGSRVQAQTLDGILKGRVASGVKIDVEGAERLVLEGARDALSRQLLQCIQLEWNHRSTEVFGETRVPVQRLLESFGYELYRPDAAGHLVRLTGPNIAEGPDVFAIPGLCMEETPRPTNVKSESPRPARDDR